MKSLAEGLDAHYAAQAATPKAPEGCSLVTFRPMPSNGLGVHPDQVQEARDFTAKSGVPTEYRPDGKPIITSSRHFRKLAKIQGFFHYGYAAAFLLLTAAMSHGQEPLPQPPGESPEPPLAVDAYGECWFVGKRPDAVTEAADDALFGRLKARIDARVEQRLIESVEEASSDKPRGFGSALAVALGRLVAKVLKAALAALLLAAVVTLLLTHWYLVAAFFGAVASVASFAGWLGGRKASK